MSSLLSPTPTVTSVTVPRPHSDSPSSRTSTSSPTENIAEEAAEGTAVEGEVAARGGETGRRTGDDAAAAAVGIGASVSAGTGDGTSFRGAFTRLWGLYLGGTGPAVKVVVVVGPAVADFFASKGVGRR